LAARTRLLDEAVPLLTLTGPGGVGKTRLTLAIASDVAAHFTDGLIWVDLAPLTDPALVPAAVASALGIVRVSRDPVDVQLVDQLRAQQTLLILDNCEHLLVAVADLAASLLARCPALQIAGLPQGGERGLVGNSLASTWGHCGGISREEQNLIVG
jgi:predicted ATPase